jgi:hypothetical protein
MTDTQEIARFEALAEEAISAIYDMRGVNVKDCFDDALYNLGRAIDIAKMRGLTEEIVRLEGRRSHIRAMFQVKFRKKKT